MEPKPLVIISHELPAAWIESLTDHVEVVMGPSTTESADLHPDLRARLPEAAGLLSFLLVPVDEALLAQAPQLKVVSNFAVGVDNIDLDACTAAGIPVGHTPGVLTAATADIAMGLLLATARGLTNASRDAREGRWGTWTPTRWLGVDLDGKTLGIVGMGQIGTAVAARARAFGLKILYANRHPRSAVEAILDATHLPLDDLLAESDFVSLNVPLTAETHHLIDRAALRRMKPSAILINTARGGVVETEALVEALQNGWIRAAGLDVTDPEPLPADHPLFALPNCLIVPHIGSATERTRHQMAERACKNVLAGVLGKRIPFCANPAVYDQGSVR